MYMSGNAALVEVLQYMLAQNKKDIKKDSEALIKELFNVINQDSIDMNVLVFDEGQRAWITDDGKINQPLTIMNKMEKGLDWGFLLVLFYMVINRILEIKKKLRLIIGQRICNPVGKLFARIILLNIFQEMLFIIHMNN